MDAWDDALERVTQAGTKSLVEFVANPKSNRDYSAHAVMIYLEGARRLAWCKALLDGRLTTRESLR